MADASGSGGIRINKLNMRQFEKKYFENYSDAEIWLAETTQSNDGQIRQEIGGKHYIFVEKE